MTYFITVLMNLKITDDCCTGKLRNMRNKLLSVIILFPSVTFIAEIIFPIFCKDWICMYCTLYYTIFTMC